MANKYKQIGQRVNDMLRVCFSEWQEGYKKYSIKLTTEQQNQILDDDFYNSFTSVPKECLRERIFWEAAQNTDKLDILNRTLFLQVIAQTQKRLGMRK